MSVVSPIDLANLARRLANVVRVGTVAEADYAPALLRVDLGDLTTDWLPWLTRRAGGDVDWWAPEVGEQVVLLAPSGELAQAVVMPALYQSATPAPADVETVRRTTFADGTTVEYDRAAHHLTVTVAGPSAQVAVEIDGEAHVHTTGAATVAVDGSADVTVGQAATVDVGTTCDVTAGGKATLTAHQVEIDGGSGSLTGTVTGQCICAFTGAPHPDYSATVKESY